VNDIVVKNGFRIIALLSANQCCQK